jgi:hypothetical protein
VSHSEIVEVQKERKLIKQREKLNEDAAIIYRFSWDVKVVKGAGQSLTGRQRE